MNNEEQKVNEQNVNDGFWGPLVTGITVAVTGIKLSAGTIISAIGFKTGGVAAGSYAAGIQASIGSVKAGSLFASAQSLGATGILIPGFETIIGSTLLIAGVYYGVKYFEKKE